MKRWTVAVTAALFLQKFAPKGPWAHFDIFAWNPRGRPGWPSGRDAQAARALAARDRIAWCPQDGYVFDSTLRGNLALSRPRELAPSQEEMEASLIRVGLGPWFAGLPGGLDTPTGAGGELLSGGQRQRLAVARTLLAGAGVVVLDEPTAHLGVDEGHELVRDVLSGAGDVALLLVTHDAELAAQADTVTVLAGSAAAEKERSGASTAAAAALSSG